MHIFRQHLIFFSLIYIFESNLNYKLDFISCCGGQTRKCANNELKNRDQGGAALIATHSKALASRADLVVRLVDGRVADYND